MTSKHRGLKAFTVVELIVAMSISAITLLSGYECFMALKQAGDRQSEDMAAIGGIVHGLGRIREDLLFALVRTESGKPTFVGSNPVVEGEKGTTQILSFYSLCSRYGDDWARGLRQICQVNYEWVKTNDSFCLYRSIVPVVGSNPASGRELILDGIEQIEITFHNGEEPEDSFTSEEKIPVGVELTVTAHGQVWPLSVKLPCGGSKGQQ